MDWDGFIIMCCIFIAVAAVLIFAFSSDSPSYTFQIDNVNVSESDFRNATSKDILLLECMDRCEDIFRHSFTIVYKCMEEVCLEAVK